MSDDWITIWQSEFAALLVDRELAESGQRTVDAWAAQARALLTNEAGPARSDAAAGAAPAADAPVRRELDELRARIAELERRLSQQLPGADPALLRGIAAYRRHPWQRTALDPPAVWSEGGSRVLDYGVDGDLPMLFVPSLVNRAHILDLLPQQSMLRWLAGRGVRPLLLDWGWPGAAERAFTLTEVVAGRLERALIALPGPVVLAGYCMGGMLTVAAALRRPDLVRALVLLATPWDFHTDEAGPRVAATLPLFEPVMQATGTLPVDALQALFAAVDPQSIGAKFRGFANMDPASDAAIRFVALEDWLNDGVPLAAPVARESLAGWYGANTPANAAWRIGGQAVRPERLEMPCFVAVPGRDKIVPPAGALVLAGLIPGAVVHRPASGHIGMAAGPRAETGLWTPLLNWLLSL